MLELVGRVAFVESSILGVAVLVFALVRFRDRPASRRLLAAFLFGAAAFLAVSIVGISVLLRDGLGPDGEPSRGTTAPPNG